VLEEPRAVVGDHGGAGTQRPGEVFALRAERAVTDGEHEPDRRTLGAACKQIGREDGRIGGGVAILVVAPVDEVGRRPRRVHKRRDVAAQPSTERRTELVGAVDDEVTGRGLRVDRGHHVSTLRPVGDDVADRTERRQAGEPHRDHRRSGPTGKPHDANRGGHQQHRHDRRRVATRERPGREVADQARRGEGRCGDRQRTPHARHRPDVEHGRGRIDRPDEQRHEHEHHHRRPVQPPFEPAAPDVFEQLAHDRRRTRRRRPRRARLA
jgi:hypothetical protein